MVIIKSSKKIKAAFVALFLLVFSSLKAQSNFKYGFLVTNSGDTTSALIDYGEELSCKIKAGDKIIYIKPDQIKGFGFYNNKYYTSQIIPEEFVRVLIQGDLSLYKHHTHYILKKNLDTVTLLIKPGWNDVIKSMTYDCLGEEYKYDELKYSQNSITKVVLQYNTCVKSKSVIFKAYPRYKLNIGIGNTFSIVHLKHKSHLTTTGYPLEFTTQSYQPALLAQLTFPRISRNFSLKTDIGYSKLHFSAQKMTGSLPYISYVESFIHMDQLSLPLSFVYTFQFKQWHVGIASGIHSDLIVDQSSKNIEESFIQSTVYTKLNEKIYEFPDAIHGLLSGITLTKNFKKFGTSLNVNYTSKKFQNKIKFQNNFEGFDEYLTQGQLTRFNVAFEILFN